MRVIRSVGPIYLAAATARSLSFPLQYHTAYTQILLFIQYVVASRVYLCWLLILHVATFKELNKLIPLRIREDIFGNGGIATLTGKIKTLTNSWALYWQVDNGRPALFCSLLSSSGMTFRFLSTFSVARILFLERPRRISRLLYSFSQYRDIRVHIYTISK